MPPPFRAKLCYIDTLLQEHHGVHPGAVLVHLEVEVGPGHVAGGALIADHRPRGDVLPADTATELMWA